MSKYELFVVIACGVAVGKMGYSIISGFIAGVVEGVIEGIKEAKK